MDDLNGINWTPSTSGSIKQKPPPMSQSSYPYTLRPTPPLSRISTPLTVPETKPSTNGIARSNASTPANDSFANLVSFNTVNPNNTISLEEQQRKLQKERARQQQGQPGIRSGQQDDDAWEQLGSGRSTPNPVHPPWKHPATEEASGYGLSKAINKPFAGIDASPRRPPQPPTNGNAPLAGFDNLGVGPANGAGNSQSDGDISGARQLQEPGRSSASEVREGATTDDDDPFGLGAMPRHSQSTKPVNQETTNGDDDILGLLGRPVSEFSPPPEPTPPSTDRPKVESPSPADRALAELVDMGFAPEKSRQALEFTESGTDVQAAVGWLLNQAHHESKSNSRGGTSQTRQDRRAQRSPPRQRSPAAKGAQPAWMRDPADRNALQSRQSSRSPVNGEKDPSKIAAELGNNLFKTANSLWKTGTKKLNQAVSELNSDSDSSQPKWMRQPRVRDQSARKTQPQQNRDTDGYGTSANPQQPTPNPNIEVTDEALMLECADARPAPRMLPRPKSDTKPDERKSQQAFPVTETSGENIPQPRFMQQSRPHRREDPKSRLSKQAIEEQTAEAYISPARRKKTTRKPPSPEPDLLFQSSEPPPNTSLPSTAQEPPPLRHPPPQPTRTPQAPKPQAPARTIPAISPSALQTSHTCRRAGTAAFKLGNYSLATTHYTSALSPLPSTHTLRVPLLANRALSYLKTGDPKACLADTQAALDLIGPSRGVGETVDLGDGEGRKDMWAYWGKAMTRQAEALEQLEMWKDAGDAWKVCVEAGVGGATSIAGRDRCARALSGTTSATAKTASHNKPKPKPRPKVSSALNDLGSADSEAVSRLRLANAAADRLDDEKFALSDVVADRVSRWRAGKENNLRALLASLDTVLWEGSGWKKVGMGELILPGKVKVVYMRGIGKCHPDKLPTTATTEQKMISAAVFAALNEAWDGFKRENGL